MAASKWILDPSHSELQFKVKHLMITNVTGQFNVLAGTLETESDDFSSSKIEFSAETASINTGSEQRDGHLRAVDFFDAEQFPTITFAADAYDAGSGEVTGQLTMHGITKPVTFEVEFSGTNKDPWGNEKAGFSLSGKINRTDWDLSWNSALETGGVLVSEDVKVSAEVQFVKQAS